LFPAISPKKEHPYCVITTALFFFNSVLKASILTAAEGSITATCTASYPVPDWLSEHNSFAPIRSDNQYLGNGKLQYDNDSQENAHTASLFYFNARIGLNPEG
jgi:hypothetical protein